jgi:hypothetical protein
MLPVNRQALRYSSRYGLFLQGYSNKATETETVSRIFRSGESACRSTATENNAPQLKLQL